MEGQGQEIEGLIGWPARRSHSRRSPYCLRCCLQPTQAAAPCSRTLHQLMCISVCAGGGDLSIGGLSDMRAYVRDASVHIVISSKNIIMYCMCTWDAGLVCARRGKKRASLECMCNKLLPLFAPHLLSISVCVV